MDEKMLLPAPLLFRAAQRGVYGTCFRFGQGSITDALFVFLDGRPDPAAQEALDAHFRARPWVCLTRDWEDHIRARYPSAAIYRRYLMKPARSFVLPKEKPIPEGYRLCEMDEAAFLLHPFSHGVNYPDFAAFSESGAGAVVYFGDEIAASASSFLSLDGEVELDVSTKEAHRGRGLACACIGEMLRLCMKRGLTVHWDAQNEISLHLAEKFGFAFETEYPVYFIPETKEGQ